METSIYEQVTNKIITALENDIIPWKKPWKNLIPQNINGRPYTGINRILLNITEYQFPFFLSFNQVKQFGGYVKRGEKAQFAVFWKVLKRTETNEEGKEITKEIPYLRYYNLFNISQTTLPASIAKKLPKSKFDIPLDENNPIENAKQLLSYFKDLPEIEYNWVKACYIPKLDKILLPHDYQFSSEEEFYSTKFHEIIHSTGHPKRLNRKGIVEINFGSHQYSKEELIAEIGTCFLCGMVGIKNTFQNSTSYIQSWIGALKNDSKMVVYAAGAAEKAVDFLLG
jgi:antirestriction protein ArdC